MVDVFQTIKTSMVQQQGGVATMHQDYLSQQYAWVRCRDVIAGSDQMKSKGTDYLPKLSNQDDKDYVAYVLRTNFYNATARTISGLIGMLFRKPPTNDSPPAIDDYLVDVDLTGTPFDIFSQAISSEILKVGRVGILIDHSAEAVDTNNMAPMTVKKAEEAGLRPILKIYYTENIINWRFDRINNVWMLSQVVLSEKFVFPKLDISGKPSEFENDSEIRYRVLDLFDGFYRNRVFRRKDGNDVLVNTIVPLMNNQPIPYIPFIVITPDGVSWNISDPPLLDLVDVNISHYKTSADYEHGCHFTGMPTFWVAGYDPPVNDGSATPEKIYLGSQTALVFSNVDAKCGFAEFTGQGLTAMTANLDRKEQQMSILGARMLATEGKQSQSTTTTAIHRTGENSVLASISINASLGLSQALCIFAEWSGNPYDCKYQINRDFLPVTVDGPTLLAMMQNWQNGSLNDEEYFDWLQRADLIEAEVSFEDHKKGEFQEKPALPTPVGAPGAVKPVIKANPETP